MTFKVPTLAEISARIRGDIRREMPGTDALPFPNTLGVFQKVFAAAAFEVYLRLAYLYRQFFASTADAFHLERHAYEYGMSRKPAIEAVGYIETTGDPDTIYPAGLAWRSAGETFTAASDARSDESGAVRFRVVAEAAGAAGNRDPGEEFQFIDLALAPTLATAATVDDAGIGGGADQESDDSLRARVLDRKRRPPQGGATSDYEQIAMAIPGVRKAWAYSFAYGPGTVGVWFLMEGREAGIPNPADVAIVAEEIEARRLIRVKLHVMAPRPQLVNVQVEGLAQDTVAVRAAIQESLAAMFANRARPGVAADPFRFSRSWIVEAIAQAVGEDQHRLLIPAGDIVISDGSIPVLGAIEYV